MNYLLTGGTGFVGRALIGQLLREGHNVNYVGRRRSEALDSRAAFHYWGAGQDPPLETVPDLDAVVNLAGEPISQRWTKDIQEAIRRSRVEGTRKLVSAMRRLPVKPPVLISASAVGYYGERGDEVLRESSGPGRGFLAEVCGDWEKEALRATEFGTRVVLVRTAMVLGKGGGALSQMLTPFRLGVGGRFGSGKQWLPWIHLQDLLNLITFAAENQGMAGAMNASAPNPITNQQFTKALGRALHRPTVMPVPKFALKAVLGEVAEFILASQRVVPEAPERAGFHFRHPEIGAALEELTR